MMMSSTRRGALRAISPWLLSRSSVVWIGKHRVLLKLDSCRMLRIGDVRIAGRIDEMMCRLRSRGESKGNRCARCWEE